MKKPFGEWLRAELEIHGVSLRSVIREGVSSDSLQDLLDKWE